MAWIRLHVIAPLVLVAVNKCARDPSVYVRKCAADSLPKLHDLRIEENNSQIVEIVGILLNDNSPGVVGAAAAAFASVYEKQDSISRANPSEFANMVCRSYMEGPDEYLSRSNSLKESPLKLDGACYTSAKSNDDIKILL
ncbi:hypothetical protein MLD38_018931 [Melastoma candidum]|uniref:Uncharacterized protein n=1 Tax=Melastoma candidum TaxID=119954 RepID=A0ACB9QUJ4_9MYRT|nr:hypothetical protein MLD38_018931 [Melastoma candidum]